MLKIFFLICCLGTVKAQTISGIVLDEQSAPVADAAVSLSADNRTVSRATTDTEGRFSLAVNEEANLILRVAAANFTLFEKRLSELGVPLQIVLSPASVSEEVTVSITRTDSRLSETPASVVVLTRENLKTSAAQTVDESLRQIAGFQLFRRSSSKTTNPTTQGANLRGTGGSGAARTAVLLDGISLNDAFGGWTYWTRVPRAALEQIEVLRGGASSLYGSSALSGAINIATPKTDAPILRFETSAGTQNTFDGSLFTAFGKKGWNFSFAAESFQTAGYIPIAREERGAADSAANSRHNSGFLTLERRFNSNSRIFARGNLFAERRDNGTRLQKNRTYF